MQTVVGEFPIVKMIGYGSREDRLICHSKYGSCGGYGIYHPACC
jgi:hypothetical protein